MNKNILSIKSSHTSQSTSKFLLKSKSISLLLCVVSLLLLRTTVWAEFCCTRNVIPLPIKMPPEQELDCSGYIGAVILPTVREADLSSCPIEYLQISYDTREFLNWMVEKREVSFTSTCFIDGPE